MMCHIAIFRVYFCFHKIITLESRFRFITFFFFKNNDLAIFVFNVTCHDLMINMDSVSIFIFFCTEIFITRNIFLVFWPFFCLDDITFIILEECCDIFFRCFSRGFRCCFVIMSYITIFRIHFCFYEIITRECRFWLVTILFLKNINLTIFVFNVACHNLVVDMCCVTIFILFCSDILVTRNIFLIFWPFFCFDDITFIIFEGSCNFFRVFFRSFFWLFGFIQMSYITGFRINFLFLIFISWECGFWLVAVFFF